MKKKPKRVPLDCKVTPDCRVHPDCKVTPDCSMTSWIVTSIMTCVGGTWDSPWRHLDSKVTAQYIPYYLSTNKLKDLNPNSEDEETIHRLVDFSFSRSTITTTLYVTKTQKSPRTFIEDTLKSNLKNVTCAVNSEPQWYSAIHRMNPSPGEFTVLKVCCAWCSSAWRYPGDKTTTKKT